MPNVTLYLLHNYLYYFPAKTGPNALRGGKAFRFLKSKTTEDSKADSAEKVKMAKWEFLNKHKKKFKKVKAPLEFWIKEASLSIE